MTTRTMRRTIVLAAGVTLTSAAAMAQSNILYMNSQPGDYIGQGETVTYTDADGTFSAQVESGQPVTVSFAAPGYTVWWDLTFAAAGGATVMPGMYEGATRYPFQSPTTPGLDIGGDGRGCNDLFGRFVVLEASYDAGGAPLTFAADFEQHCEGGDAALYGAVRFNSSLPIVPLLSIGDAAIVEGPSGVPLTFTISLSGPAPDSVTVDWATVDDSAAAGTHYVAASGTVTFAAGQTAQSITVQTLNDELRDGDHSFLVDLSDPSGADVAFGQARGTVFDRDGPQSALMLLSDPGDDIGQGKEQVLTRVDGVFSAEVINRAVYVSFRSDTWWGLHFAAPQGRVLTPGRYEGATRWSYSTSSQPGLDVEGDGRGCNMLSGRFVVYEAAYGAGGVLSRFAADFEQHCEGAVPALRGAVRFNSTRPIVPPAGNRGVLEFSAARYSVSESSGVATITVRRRNGNGLATVNYSTGDGTAESYVDYWPQAGTLTFTGTQALATFTVPIERDTINEANKTVVLRLTDPEPAWGGASLGPQSTAVLTIVDDDAGGKLLFSPAVYSVDTAAAAGSVKLKVARTGGLASGVSVHCTMSDGTALGGVDYDDTPLDLTFGAGVVSQTLTIPVSQNTSGAKTFSVTLSAPTGGAALGTPTVATVTIVGAQPTLSFGSAAYSVKTTQPTALITVKRSGPLTGTATVHYATSPGTASPGGVDYKDVGGTLTFGPSVVSRTFTVPISPDPLVDVPRTVNLTLSAPTWTLGTATLDTTLSTSTLTIINPNLAPTVQFSPATYTVGEAGLKATLTVKRTGDLVGTVTVDYAATGGSATNGDPALDPNADYTLNAGTLTFGPNVIAKAVTIPIVNDTRAEGTETAEISLSNPTWTGGTAVVGPAGMATLTIIDNEPTIQFAAAAATVSEAAATVTIGVRRTGSLAAQATVAYAVTGGSATADTGSGGDYVAPAPGTLTFLANQASKTLTITLEPDKAADGDKTIELTLSAPTGAELGTPRATVVTIRDDEVAGKAQLSASTFSTVESGGGATITVTRSGGTAGGATVDYETLDSDPGTSAAVGTDYSSTSGTLTFGPGETVKTFTIPILDDGVPDHLPDPITASIALRLHTPGGGVALGAPSTATLWIAKE